MIKPTELRLGNWIKKYENGWDFKQVTASDIAELEATPPHAEDMRFQPILLTGEVLELCGGESSNGTPFYEIDFGQNIGQIAINPDNGMTWLKHHRHGNTLNPTDVRYLHQLQNFFYIMTGQELQINL